LILPIFANFSKKMNPSLKRIQMVDLGAQYQHIKLEVDAAVAGVIDSCAFINGPEVKAFSQELADYLKVKHVIPCANGTDALQIAMMALDLKPGDEVITANFTYVATAEVIKLLGLTAVLVEVNPDTFTIDPEAIRKAITPKTKAIVPVHLYGQCADMEPILAIADQHSLYVIEDTAQAIGSTYRFSDGRTAKAGTMGTVGCTSFFPSKNLGCYGDGGAMYTNNDDLAQRLRMIANHGQRVQYIHDDIGVNSRLDSIQAAVLRIKLRHLDSYAASRNRAADHYDRAFSGNPALKVPGRAPWSDHVFHQYTLTLQGGFREALREQLQEKGIPTMIYYPLPLHHQKAYEDARFRDEDFSITLSLCKGVVSLPMHTELDDETLAYISDLVNAISRKLFAL
jgi:UDP-2-acetamido-2-deoxy-ribo-hexuluronate aminotransferase